LPIGILQFMASASEGLWYARSEAFMQQRLLQTLRWVRTFGDLVFIAGALGISLQVVLGLLSRTPAVATARRASVAGALG
ncbi:MAG: nitric-oxide reductase large subunit, partial [Comamonadaceae bacterium]